MVGHGLAQDLKILRSLGYNIWALPQFFDLADTSSMAQHMARSTNQIGLEDVANRLGISGTNFHNAGNDAVYTLQVMMALTLEKVIGPSKSDGGNENPWCTPDAM